MEPAHRNALLVFAHETIRAHLAGTPLPAHPQLNPPPPECGGAFVTIHNRGRLRGCIGRFDCPGGLLKTVQDMAIAALHDPRFGHCRVTLPELSEIDIEISLLSPMRRAADPLALEPGVHGLVVRRGNHVGCFLPQVGAEMGWNAELLLSHCCADKAGLPSDAWKDPNTEVHLFTAEVFGEHSDTA